ncbi:uncharacterized protein VDAG_04548 [Verticillium dahliae VdLs.17]|uniref:Zn(2)-C6 fungal-type domain-containing protein n=3 Tax=Verticillium TaxID=1036719 RepID=G2X2M4_VERDV|nr:uncharacterized protein VDAG_04548 [Verticillium dahliae VdLs.17]EGY23110.1 hypothetical protein VDAG_04548 [Verticillium dahliae VdLs.17]KAF3346081.1 hypothetical protein VdG2_05340 [Verticillium dahliae VDG2]KAH6700092.1 hypothetical protein EV126DRAFT_476770 [Verticillium dahliae]
MSDTDGENDADAGSSQGPPSSGRKVACSQCHQRKVKCDREHPYLACLTTGRDCTGSPAPGPRRPRRQNNHVLRAKLESLESLLQQCIESQHTGIEKHPLKSAVPDGLSPTAPRPTESDDEAKQPKGYLVQTRSGGVEFRSGKISSLVFHDEHYDLLGRTKTDTMAMLSRGFKATITQLNYVSKYNPEVPRALIFYSLARQGAQRRSCDPWILHGLIVNIAYSLGLHIDGEGTGLSPFDFVMRSRLWRQVVLVELEVKHTVAAGVGTFLMRKLSNTKLPSNLDDRELDPHMVTLPQSHNRPTDMSFCLTAYERCFWMAGKLQQKEIHLVDELIFSDPSREVDEAVTKKRSDARD